MLVVIGNAGKHCTHTTPVCALLTSIQLQQVAVDAPTAWNTQQACQIPMRHVCRTDSKSYFLMLVTIQTTTSLHATTGRV